MSGVFPVHLKHRQQSILLKPVTWEFSPVYSVRVCLPHVGDAHTAVCSKLEQEARVKLRVSVPWIRKVPKPGASLRQSARNSV